MKKNTKYKSCRDVTFEECYNGGKYCATCMYRDNERYKDGFRKDSDVSGVYDWCSAVKLGKEAEKEGENEMKKDEITINEWLEYGGGLCVDQMTNSLYMTRDDEEMADWYKERDKEYADMSMDDYLKLLAKNALEWAKIDEDKIAEYMDY